MPVAFRPTELPKEAKNKSTQLVTGFRSFLHDYGVLPLAVGVVIGNAVNDLVKTLVDGLITPFIALVAPESRLQNFQFTIYHSTFKIGAIIDATITFVVVALVVYFAAKVVLRNDELLKKK